MDDDQLLAALLQGAPAPPSPAGGAPPAIGLEIAPASVEGHVEADYALALHNRGARAVSVLLSADDRGRILGYELGAERLSLEPGQTVHIPLTIEAPRRLLGATDPIAFTVYAEPEAGAVVAAEARFVRRPLLSARLALLLALLLLAALIGAPLAGRLASRGEAPAVPQPAAIPTPAPGAPLIATFAASPAAVGPGEPVVVYWDVRGAERVSIEPFGPVPPLGQREYRPAQSGELRLVAGAGGRETVAVLRVLVGP